MNNKNLIILERVRKILLFIIMLFGFFFIPNLIYSLVSITGIFKDKTLMGVISTFIYTLCLVIIFRKMYIKDLKDYKKNFSKYLKISLKYWGLGLLIMGVSNLIINLIVFKGDIASNEVLNRQMIFASPILGYISAVLLAPITEELTFRYAISKIFNNKYVYAITSGLIFGLLHAVTAYKSPLDLLYTIPYGALGFAFALIYEKTDNIIANTTMHMLHNFMCLTLMFTIM
ncbi:MAG: type II CAAX endopeptidase family protein [Bacilli bacterium]